MEIYFEKKKTHKTRKNSHFFEENWKLILYLDVPGS